MADVDLEALPGVGPATAEKLNEAGFDSYQSLAVASPGELSDTADIGESTSADIIQAARKEADIGGFETGSQVLERRERIGKLSWQIDEVDELLGGGVETQSITEVYGEFGAGKSQITHQLSVNVQLPPEAGRPPRQRHLHRLRRHVPSRAYRRHGSRPAKRRIQATMDDREIEGSPDDDAAMDELIDDILDKIHVAKAFNSNHQMLLAEKAEELAGEHEDGEWPVRLLCIDILTAHFRAEYVGRGQLADSPAETQPTPARLRQGRQPVQHRRHGDESGLVEPRLVLRRPDPANRWEHPRPQVDVPHVPPQIEG